MCGRSKWSARARAIVPLPLAAGPSTAITRLSFGERSRAILLRRFDSAISLWQGAPPNAARSLERLAEFKLELISNGEARVGHQAHLPQVLDAFLRPRQRGAGALHQLRHRMAARAGAEIQAATGLRGGGSGGGEGAGRRRRAGR